MSSLDQNDFPVILNGYVVLGSFILPCRNGYKDSRVIFIDRIDDETDERYVVAYHCVGDHQWIRGEYFRNRNKALDYFIRLIKREYNK